MNDYVKDLYESLKNNPNLAKFQQEWEKAYKEEFDNDMNQIKKDLLNIERLVNKEIEKRNKELDEIDKSINKFFERKW